MCLTNQREALAATPNRTTKASAVQPLRPRPPVGHSQAPDLTIQDNHADITLFQRLEVVADEDEVVALRLSQGARNVALENQSILVRSL